MEIAELEIEIVGLLKSLKVEAKKVELLRDLSIHYVVPSFGIVLSGIHSRDYSQISTTLNQTYPDWKYLFISTNENVHEVKDAIIWEFIRSGYMHWLRFTYNRAYTRLITERYGKLIIEERLKFWGDKPKYKYLVDLNKDAKNMSVTYLLSIDPGFFDYVP